MKPGFSVLGLDVGGSATRWCLDVPGQSTTRRGEEKGFSGHLFRPEIRNACITALNAIFGLTGPVDAIVAGVTGLSQGAAEAQELTDMLRKQFGASRIRVMNDVELACRVLAAPAEEAVVYAGTGSIAAFVRADGDIETAGGKGVLIDDAGGGYWIAVAALRHILRADDVVPGSGWSTELGQHLDKRLGGSDWATVRRRFYGMERGEIGYLAIAVRDAAEAGDLAAQDIFREAGRELGLLATAIARRGNLRRIVLSGRASQLSPLIRDAMQTACPDLDIRHVELDAAKGAVNLAHAFWPI